MTGTFILSASVVHRVRAKGAGGFVTSCAVVIPGPAVYVKVQLKAGQQVPTRGWLCKACFGDGK